MSDTSTRPVQKPSGAWRLAPEEIERINFVAAREAGLRLRGSKGADFIASVIRALDTWEREANRGVPRLHAMEKVLMEYEE